MGGINKVYKIILKMKDVTIFLFMSVAVELLNSLFWKEMG